MTDDGQNKVKRRQWNPEDMEAAMRAVQQEKKTVSAAAKQHSVPRKTLDDRIRGRVIHGSNPGPSTVLTAREEDALASYLL